MQYNTTRYIDENQDNKTLKDMMKNGVITSEYYNLLKNRFKKVLLQS
ncbi:hypothetical protein O673_02813 [Staphylococcus aureus M0658]|nr:hypothetical protein O673_02813 [Staphylococcus aureus M0658]